MASVMLIFTKTSELELYLKNARARSATVGFVPTMGALHQGHVSLITLAKKQCSVTICSIFVNPTQFNDKKDLERYPRVPEKDILLLEQANCDVLFLPTVIEIYPEPKTETFEFGYLNTILEGKYRPGHFNGVAQVVKRFFEIVEPDAAFFGSKDYQQVMIVKALVHILKSNIKVVSCPILREKDGLAMSSRNALLNNEERALAAMIPKMMIQARDQINKIGIEAAKTFVKNQIAQFPLIRFEYFEVAEADSLKIVDQMLPNVHYIALIAVFVGRIRLIDNLPLHE
jgi:pantoate--beta-alanine ligase